MLTPTVASKMSTTDELLGIKKIPMARESPLSLVTLAQPWEDAV
jgi:hypothetical protein